VSDICQESFKDFMLTDDEVFLKHAEQSAAYAYHKCDGFFENHIKDYGFSENEYHVLARYIASRQLPHVKGVRNAGWTQTTKVQGQEIRDVDILKNILMVLKDSKLINHHMVITPQMYDEFMEQYERIKK
jgi:hypothetical protein